MPPQTEKIQITPTEALHREIAEPCPGEPKWDEGKQLTTCETPLPCT